MSSEFVHNLFGFGAFLAFRNYHVNVEFSEVESTILVGCSSDVDSDLESILKFFSGIYDFEYKKYTPFPMSDKKTSVFKISF